MLLASQSINLKYIINFLLFIFCFSNLSFGQKLKYAEVNQVIQQSDAEKSIGSLKAFIEKNPNHALAHFELGRIYGKQFQDQVWYKETNPTYYHEQANFFLNKAQSLLGKKEIRKNKSHYQNLTSLQKPSLPTVTLFFNQASQELANYFEHFQKIQEKSTALNNHYGDALKIFNQIVGKYPDPSLLHFSAQNLIDKEREKIIQHFEAIAIIQAELENLYQVAGWDKQRQSFSLKPLGKKWGQQQHSTDLLKNKTVVLGNYGAWAKVAFPSKREEVQQVKTQLTQFYQKVNRKIKRAVNGVAQKSLPKEERAFLENLKSIDSKGLATQLMTYQLNKLGYFNWKNAYQQANYSNNQLQRGEAYDQLVYHIQLCRNNLQNVAVEQSDELKYGEFIEQNFGSASYLNDWLKEEKRLIENEFNFWQLNLANHQEQDEDRSLMGWRSAQHNLQFDVEKLNLELILSSSDYQITHQVAIPDGGSLIAGTLREQNSNKRDVFIAKFNALNQHVWVRRFSNYAYQKTLNDEIISVEVSQQGESLIALSSSYKQVNYFRVAALHPNGSTIFDNFSQDKQKPQKVGWLGEGSGFFVVLKGEKGEENPLVQEPLKVVHYNRIGKEIRRSELPIKGNYVDLVASSNGFALVLNFLEYSENQETVLSQANEGFNVLLLFLDKNFNLIQSRTVPAVESMVATQAHLDEYDRLVVEGKKGLLQEKKSQGESWQLQFDTQDIWGE